MSFFKDLTTKAHMYNLEEAFLRKSNAKENKIKTQHIEDVIDSLIERNENIGISKELKNTIIGEKVLDPLSLFQKLNVLRKQMPPFKKSVKEIDRLLQELRFFVINEYQEAKENKNNLEEKKRKLEKSIEYDKKKIEGIPKEIASIENILKGNATVFVVFGNRRKKSEYEVNVKTGDCHKLGVYESRTELKGWDREETEGGYWEEISKPSSKIYPLIVAIDTQDLKEHDILNQEQKNIVIERLQEEIIKLEREKSDVLMDSIEHEMKEIQLLESEMGSLKNKMREIILRNKTIFPELHSVKIRKKK